MATKLLLTEDVTDLGRKGDIVSVRPGYARNYLFPKKFAVIADKKALKMQERLKEERRLKAVQDKKDSEEMAQRVDAQTLTKSAKVDHEGHLYGSVSVNDILHMIEHHFAVKLEKSSIHLKHPIKEVGVYSIPIKLKEDVVCSITLKVISDEAEEQTAETK